MQITLLICTVFPAALQINMQKKVSLREIMSSQGQAYR